MAVVALIAAVGCQIGGGDPNQVIIPAGSNLHNQTYSLFLPVPITFSPTATGKTITVTVASNVTASRITLNVTDSSGSPVITNNAPTSNSTTGTFGSTSTGLHTIVAVDIGGAAATYTVTVTQSG